MGKCESCSNGVSVITIYDYEKKMQLNLCNSCYSRFATTKHRVVKDFERTSMQGFIKEYKQGLDNYIHKIEPNIILNDDIRETWILYHKLLCIWARSRGVKI